MKYAILGRSILAFSFVMILFSSCSDSGEKKKDNAKDSTAKQSNKDDAATKETSKSTKMSEGGKWNADAANAKIKFSVKGILGTAHGSVTGLQSTILFDEHDLSGSSIKASTDAKTVKTGIKMRDRHLQKEEYLNTDNYTSLRFQSTKIEKSGAGFKAIGNLTIKGVTKQVEIPFTFSQKGASGLFKGSFSIERLDYKIGGSGGSIGKTITIDLEVPVTR